MLTKKEVIKHSAAVQVSCNQISLLQRKIWNVLLANAYDDLQKKERYSIKMQDLMKVLNFDSNDIELLKDSVRKMHTIAVEWNTLDKDQEKIWIGSNFMGEVVIKPKSGIVHYAWGPEFRKLLYNPTMYAKINLIVQSRFKSKYSLNLYELCVDYFIKKQGRGETPWISVDDFRKLMGVENDKYYNNFKRLNARIIKHAITEVNKESDISVDMVKKLDLRKVVALKFHITPTDKVNNILTRLTEGSKQDGFVFNSEDEREKELYERMTKYFCLSDKQAKEILNSMFDLDQVEAILEMMERKVRRDEIKSNLGAYTYKALKEDYRPKRSFFEIEKEQQAQARKQLERTEAWERGNRSAIENKYADYEKAAVKSYFSSLSRTENMALEENFEKSLNPFERNKYREDGLNSPLMNYLFRQFVIVNYLRDKVLAFTEFAEREGSRNAHHRKTDKTMS